MAVSLPSMLDRSQRPRAGPLSVQARARSPTRGFCRDHPRNRLRRSGVLNTQSSEACTADEWCEEWSGTGVNRGTRASGHASHSNLPKQLHNVQARHRMADQRRRRAVARWSMSSSHTAVGGEPAHVQFDDGAAAWNEVVPQHSDPRRPVDTRPGCYGDSTVARAQEEVSVDLPAVGLCRGEARHRHGRR